MKLVSLNVKFPIDVQQVITDVNGCDLIVSAKNSRDWNSYV